MKSGGLRKPHPQPSTPDFGTQLYVTPEADVDMACIYALTAFLSSKYTGRLASMWHDPGRGEPDKPPVASPSASVAELLDLWQTLGELKVLDPACGEGHFLLGMLQVLTMARATVGRQILTHKGACEREVGRLKVTCGEEAIKRDILSNTLYGVEVEATRIARAEVVLRQGTGLPGVHLSSSNRDHLICCDAFSLGSCGAWEEVDGRGGFDIVLGNPPFVRHERIRDPLETMNPSKYREVIERMIYQRFPQFFLWDAARATARLPLGRRADLAALFTFLGFSLVRPGGTLAFVLPKALLQAQYGLRLRQALAQEAEVTLWERAERRSFKAGVNTVTLIAAKRESGGSERKGPKHRMSTQQGSQNRHPVNWESTMQGSRHMRPVNLTFTDSIAPRFLEKVSNVVPLGSVGTLRYAIKTGINEFFYPSAETIKRFGIEPQFLKPVLRSPRIVERICVDEDALNSLLFHCSDSLIVLRNEGRRGALEYIKWGMAQQSSKGVTWPAAPSVKRRKLWYSIALPKPAHIICPRFFDRRFFFLQPTSQLVEDQTFYGLVLPEGDPFFQTCLAALLNSSIVYLFLETFGRTGLGEGVRQYALCDYSSLPIPNPQVVSGGSMREMKESFERLCRRPILQVDEEMRQEDRHRLDSVTGKAFGLTEQDMESARETLARLTSMRLLRAKNILHT